MARYSKFLVALSTALATVLTVGLATGTAAKIVTVAITFIGALGVYAVPNKPPYDEGDAGPNHIV